MIAPDEQPEGREILTRILCQGEPADFSIDVRTATGGFAVRDISAAPVRDGGSIVGMFGFSRRTRPVASPRSPGAELTPRQHEVLGLLAEGKSTAEIAATLALSPITVRNHIAGLIAALGVHTRLQAVVAARRAGLLEL